MPTRLQRALSSRPARKLARNRPALLALAVIALYAAVALAVFAADLAKSAALRFGSLTPERYAQRHPVLDFLTAEKALSQVGPVELPGLGLLPSPEERARAVKTALDEVGQAFALRPRGSTPHEQRLRRALAELAHEGRPFDADLALPEARARWQAARAIYDELNAADDLDQRPDLLPRLADLEAATRALFAQPPGIQATLDRFARVLGTDRQGRSVVLKAVYSVKVAIQIGLVVALVATLLGALLGAAAAFFGGWVDQAVVWLYSTLSSLPDLVLLGVLVFMFTGSIFDDVTRPYLSLVPLYTAMCLTFWIGPARVIRGEVLRIRELEYVQAATAIGFSRPYILLRHALPNTVHLMLINFSLLFVAAIKNEVVLSFLGLGVKAGTSWGRMIDESVQQVINGFYWQIAAATLFMFGLVLAFNVLSDALQDAFDPKHVG